MGIKVLPKSIHQFENGSLNFEKLNVSDIVLNNELRGNCLDYLLQKNMQSYTQSNYESVLSRYIIRLGITLNSANGFCSNSSLDS